jgi:hypothetical protein
MSSVPSVYVFFFLDGRLPEPPAPPPALALALAGVDARDILSTLSAFWTSSITRFCSNKRQNPSPTHTYPCISTHLASR